MRPKYEWTISILAVFLGIVVNFLAVPIDQFFHTVNVFPPWGEPMLDVSDNLLALSYRVFLAIAGGYVTARLAPNHPMWHAVLLGGIGFILSSGGAYHAISQMDAGPLWYPVLLVLICIPASFVGARMFASRS